LGGGYEPTVVEDDDDDDVETSIINDDVEFHACRQHLTPKTTRWAEYCQTRLPKSHLLMEELKTLEVILIILRNLSFVGSQFTVNGVIQRHLVHSGGFLV
jgi:hypothetical protein